MSYNLCVGPAGSYAAFPRWPALPQDIQRHVLQSPGLPLPALARASSTCTLFHEVCRARCQSEDTWLSDLAAASFGSQLLTLLTRWLTLVRKDNFRPEVEALQMFDATKGEWPGDPALTSVQHITVLCHVSRSGGPPSSSSTSAGGDADAVSPTPWEFTMLSIPARGDHLLLMQQQGSICYGPVSITYNVESGARIVIAKHAQIPLEASLALAYVACKALGREQEARRYPGTVVLPRLRVTNLGKVPDAWLVPCPWGNVQKQVPCARAARALAVMHWWNRCHGEGLPALQVQCSV